MASSEPVEVPDQEHERIFDRVCAIDVAKGSGKVCTRLPHPEVSGRRVSTVWDVDAHTRDVIALGDHLVCQGVEIVTLESTSDYVRHEGA
jgi:transposase